LNIEGKCRTYIKSPREDLRKIAFSQDRYHPLRRYISCVSCESRASRRS